MPKSTWNPCFHLRSPRGWLNDPNGCCQFRGTYRFFYQYNPAHPAYDQKAWGQFSSPDLVHWRYEGVSIEPSIPEDRHGVYSGCCVVERGAAADGGDRLRAYYTGNVICIGPDHDPHDCGLIYDGREANEITCTSDDGVHFGTKEVLLRTADYPDFCALHVRDPKVWEQDGRLFMLLGARHINNHGMCLLFESSDGSRWTFAHAIDPQYPFGYMWECPNVVLMDDGHEYLAFSPQGLPRLRDRWQNLCQAGYVPLSGQVASTYSVDERDFVEWDHGHDFYAPQTFCDDAGRWILVGWLGCFDRNYDSAPDGLDWWHCLTVPRLLSRDERTGLLMQTPVPELDALRRDETALKRDETTVLRGRHADVLLEGIEGEGSLSFDAGLQVFFESGRLGIRYVDETTSAGRQERSVPLAHLDDLRVLVDGSVVEVYANAGREVFSSRWFCSEQPDLHVSLGISCSQAHAWRMEDTMSDMYATADAPDLAMPGWNAR